MLSLFCCRHCSQWLSSMHCRHFKFENLSDTLRIKKISPLVENISTLAPWCVRILWTLWWALEPAGVTLQEGDGDPKKNRGFTCFFSILEVFQLFSREHVRITGLNRVTEEHLVRCLAMGWSRDKKPQICLWWLLLPLPGEDLSKLIECGDNAS